MIFVLEITDTPDLDTHVNFYTCLNGLDIHFNKSDYSKSASAAGDWVNCIRFVLNDIQCWFGPSVSGRMASDCVPFLGPITMQLELGYNVLEMEIFSAVNLGSFCVSVNRGLVDLFHRMNEFIGNSLEMKKVNHFKVYKIF